MMAVTLINPFEVPAGREAEALKGWDVAADYLRKQPGFISTKLHEALAPGGKFHFINVAQWAEKCAPLFAEGKPKEAFAEYPWVQTTGEPFARLRKPASESRFALITTGGYSAPG